MRNDHSRGISIAADFHRKDGPAKDAGHGTGTSLVPLAPAAPQQGDRYRQPRALATFVTQLIAKSQHAPHLRDRRRAAPGEAAAAYRNMLNISGVPKRYKTQ